MNNFKYAISLAQMLYDIDINDMDTLIEIGLVAYNFIGNKHTHLKSEIVNVDKKSGLVKLPCKVDLIEAITLSDRIIVLSAHRGAHPAPRHPYRDPGQQQGG